MKNIFLALSSVCALTFSSNSIIGATTNEINNNSSKPESKSLFNNFFGALGTLGNTSTWITNQSTSDQKYYSYNMEDADYKLSDGIKSAYNYFIVDNKGSLNFTDDEKNLPSSDQNLLINTKTVIEQNKTVTAAANSYNPYSRSIYSDNYYNSGFSNWQFLQFGAIEKHIDLSKAPKLNDTDKVENYKDLSENLGLYYIAKATHQRKITESLAASFAKYFISQTSLSNKINLDLTNALIKLLVHNTTIYNFINSAPFYIKDKNYSLNFIFDNTNKLISISYNKWNNTNNETRNVNYSQTLEYFPKTQTHNSIAFFKWNNYTSDWNVFSKMYTTFAFDNSSLFEVSGTGGTSEKAKLTNAITTAKITTENSSFFQIHANASDIPIPRIPVGKVDLAANLNFYHDNVYIYFQWFLTVHTENSPPASTFKCNLNNVTFYNIMN